MNRRQVPRLAELIMSRLPEGGTAGILGLSYKPNTEVIDESQGVALAKELLARGVKVVVFDPAAMENARKVLLGHITFARSAEECAAAADVAAVMTAWAEFKNLRFPGARPSTVLDCWRLVENPPQGSTCLRLGQGAGMPTADEAVTPTAVPSA